VIPSDASTLRAAEVSSPPIPPPQALAVAPRLLAELSIATLDHADTSDVDSGPENGPRQGKQDTEAAAMPSYPTAPPAMAAVLHSLSQPESDDNVFGFVLLARRDSRKDAICRAFSEMLTPAQDNAARRPTFWLLRESSLIGRSIRKADCDTLTAEYDAPRAHVELTSFGFASARGPVLLGVAPQADAEIIITLDLSSTPDVELAQTFRIWRGIMTSDPARWPALRDYTALPEDARKALINATAPIASYIAPKAARVPSASLRRSASETIKLIELHLSR
jgi:hypothetical protein